MRPHQCGVLCAGYLAYLGLVQAGWVKARKVGRSTRKVETKKKEVNSDEWLKGTYYNQVRRICHALLKLDAPCCLLRHCWRAVSACVRGRGLLSHTTWWHAHQAADSWVLLCW